MFGRNQSCYNLYQNNIQKKSNNYSRRTTTTAVYVFVCLVFCNVTQLSGMMYTIVSKYTNNIMIRNFLFWPLLALYSNSLFNALILMCRSRHLKKEITLDATMTYQKYKSTIRRRSSAVIGILSRERQSNKTSSVIEDVIEEVSEDISDDSNEPEML